MNNDLFAAALGLTVAHWGLRGDVDMLYRPLL